MQLYSSKRALVIKALYIEIVTSNGLRYRDLILSRGNTQNYGDMFKTFRGYTPDIKPMLISRGLAGK